tara:strand:+ start:1164 stop:1880 length:717 start_codon:yes stop_codon:yes gene_type:complete
MADKKHIALVDDDINILTSLSIALKSEGYQITTYTNGEEALAGILKSPPDLAILDIKMPRMDGIELIKRLNKKADIPIIFLTSKDDEYDEILGLRLGAEDYITKPFSQKLLIERLRVIMRRQDKMAEMVFTEETTDTVSEDVKQGDLYLDDGLHQCFWQDQKVDLTVTEYLLIKSLAVNPGHVKNRQQIMDYAYSEDTYLEDRVIDSHIKRVRKKFKDVDPDFDNIETVYGMGYRYRA